MKRHVGTKTPENIPSFSSSAARSGPGSFLVGGKSLFALLNLDPLILSVFDKFLAKFMVPYSELHSLEDFLDLKFDLKSPSE